MMLGVSEETLTRVLFVSLHVMFMNFLLSTHVDCVININTNVFVNIRFLGGYKNAEKRNYFINIFNDCFNGV